MTLLSRISTAALLSITVLTTAAGNVGEWHHYPAFAMPAGQTVRAADMTYYTAGGNLFSYNTSTGESRSYSLDNLLNDTDIASIYFNPLGNYLFVAYTSGNIDLLYDQGQRVVNIPDIAEADVDGSKQINDVEFAAGGRVYIATDFGLVEYDDRRHEVVQSGIYNKAVTQVEVLGDYLLIFQPSQLLAIMRGERFNSLDKFTSPNGFGTVLDMIGVGHRQLLLRRGNTTPDNNLTLFTYSDDFSKIDGRQRIGAFSNVGPVMAATDSTLYVAADSALYTINLPADGSVKRLSKLPSDINGMSIGRNASDVWRVGIDGLEAYDLTGQNPEPTMQPFKPESMTLGSVAYLTPSRNGEELYAFNLGPTVYRMKGSDEGLLTPQQTVRIGADGSIEDIAATGYISEVGNPTRSNQIKLGLDIPLAPAWVTPHPADGSTYYLATGNDGLLRVSQGHVTGIYNQNNSNMSAAWGCRVSAAGFDPEGNLWVAHMPDQSTDAVCLNMLPADKVAIDPAEVTPADWKAVRATGFFDSPGAGGKDFQMLISPSTGMIFLFGERSNSGMLALSTGRTWSDFSDDRYQVWYNFTDQDGKSFAPDRFTALCEDSRGRVWIGTSQGICEISNPANAVNPEMTVNRLKVPRNDGTNSADYLLDADLIFSISEDNAGRKWIATQSSGAYLVSENGQEIINHLSSDNSILPSNSINAIYADRRSNLIWIGTNEGLFSYSSDASPAHDNFDEVMVYPNPVKPGFQGMLTITGLMDGTLLKIADAAGNVVAQLRSQGGMAQWNCENNAGRRVPTGVYYVMLSAGTGSDSSSTSGGAVAKFLVVN